jgi:hypothetical protein
LKIAAKRGHLSVVNYLLYVGVSIEDKNEAPLGAVENEHKFTARRLAQSGVSEETIQNAIAKASQNEDQSIVEMLRGY